MTTLSRLSSAVSYLRVAWTLKTKDCHTTDRPAGWLAGEINLRESVGHIWLKQLSSPSDANLFMELNGLASGS